MRAVRLYMNGGKPGAFQWPSHLTPMSMEELYKRQLFQESRFNPKAVSSAGAQGLAQFMPATSKGLARQYGEQFKDFDPFDPKQAKRAQETMMMGLFTAPWNKGNEENQLIKALAAYNYGSGNVVKLLNKLKDKGVDIYNSTEWTENLPKETRGYIQNIMYGGGDRYEEEYMSSMDKYDQLFAPPAMEAPVQEVPQEDISQAASTSRVDTPGFTVQKERLMTEPRVDPQLQDAFKILKEGQRTVSPELQDAFKILRESNQ